MGIVKVNEGANGFAVVQAAEGGAIIATLAGPFSCSREARRAARAIAREQARAAARVTKRRRRMGD